MAQPATPSRPGPAVAVLMVIADPEPLWLRRSLQSVLGQSHRHWRLSLAMCGTPSDVVASVLSEELSGVDAARVSRVTTAPDTPYADALALAFDGADAPFVLVVGQHDELAPDAVALLGEAVADAPLAYGDEDQIDAVETAWQPALKPDWSPDLLLSTAYLGRPLLADTRLVIESGGIRSVADGDWEHDLMLRMTEHTDQVTHVAEVLYGRRSQSNLGSVPSDPGMPSASSAPEAGCEPVGAGAVTGAAIRRGEVGTVEPGPMPDTWHFRRTPPARTSVSAIVPFRDGAAFLRTCTDSVTATTEDVDLQFVLVDNGSVEPETLSLLERLETRHDVTVVGDDRSFNWAALNNAAVDAARGDVLLFLNNDIEARHSGWLGVLAAQALRPDVAAVGARLVYPGGRVQHAGVVIGIGLAVLGVPYALLLAFIAAIFQAIPMVGAVISGPIILLVVLATSGWEKMLIVLAIFTVIQVLDQNIISPIIFGARVQMSFLLVILATIVGGTLLGIPGAFLAVPAAAVLQVIVVRVIAPAIRRANP